MLPLIQSTVSKSDKQWNSPPAPETRDAFIGRLLRQPLSFFFFFGHHSYELKMFLYYDWRSLYICMPHVATNLVGVPLAALSLHK
jgi:hypothetical protein